MNAQTAPTWPDVLEPANEHLVQLLPPPAVKAAEKARTLGSVMQVRANALCFVDQREAFRGYGSAVSLMGIPAVMAWLALTGDDWLLWFLYLVIEVSAEVPVRYFSDVELTAEYVPDVTDAAGRVRLALRASDC